MGFIPMKATPKECFRFFGYYRKFRDLVNPKSISPIIFSVVNHRAAKVLREEFDAEEYGIMV